MRSFQHRMATHRASGPARSLVAVPALLIAIATVLLGLQPAAEAAPAKRLLVQDDFQRNRVSGWGRAEAGGSWTRHGSPVRTSVRSGNSQVIGLKPGAATESILAKARAANVSATVQFKVPAIPRRSGWGVYTGLNLRYQSNGETYQVLVHVGAGGVLHLDIARRLRNGSNYNVMWRSAGRTSAGKTLRLDAQITGSTLRARIYNPRRSAPAWMIAGDFSARRIVRAGSVGIYAYVSNAARQHVTLKYSSTKAYELPAGSQSTGVGRSPAKTKPKPKPPTPVKPTPTVPTPAPTPSPTAPTPSPTTPTPSPTTPTPSPTTPSPSPTTPSPSPTTPSPSPTTPSPSPTTPSPSPTTPAPASKTAGSAPVGSTTYAVPSDAVFVAPAGSDSYGSGTQAAPYSTVAFALKRVRSGGTVVLRGGSYHENVFVGAAVNATIQAYPNEAVWFDGSTVVNDWSRNGDTWVHSGWTAEFDHSASFSKGSDAGGFVNASYPMAAYPDQVFLDGRQFDQVAANPKAGQFSVDYNADTITIGSDPTGHVMRASDLQQAFVVAGRINLRGVGVRRYATSLPQIGTVFFGGNVGGSRMENVVVSDSASQGISMSVPNVTLSDVSSIDNGMTGIEAGYADGGVIDNVLVTGSNTQHFNAGPSSAGIKILRLNGFTIRDTVVRDNQNVTGIWTDESVRNFAITGNTVTNNGPQYGILTELSDTGIVANNVVTGARYGYTAYDSGNVQVYNNTFSGNSVWDVGGVQDDRYLPGKSTAGASVKPTSDCPWITQNNTVVNNRFAGTTGLFQLYVLDRQTKRPASSMNWRIEGNTFSTRYGNAPWVIGWGGSDNSTVATYASSDAFNQGTGNSWVNISRDSRSTVQNAPDESSVAVPLPADVAAATGKPTGTRRIGAF